MDFSGAVAASWISYVESSAGHRRVETLYPHLNSWLEQASAQDVLDIGCGQGVCSAHINLQGRRYHGIDASPDLINRALQLYGSAVRQFSVSSVYDLPFEQASFDAAFSVSVWHLLEDAAAASREAFRVLRPGGRLLVIAANPDAYEEWTQDYSETETKGQCFTGTLRTSEGRLERDRLFLRSTSEITGYLSGAGFLVERIEGFAPSEARRPGLFLSIASRKA